MYSAVQASVVAALAAVSLGCASVQGPYRERSPELAAVLVDSGTSLGRVYRTEQVEKPTMFAQGNQPPGLPMSVDGHATLRFVVNADGRVVPSTVEVLPGSERRLAEPFLAALPRFRFLPALLPGGRAVPQVTELIATKRGSATIIRLATDPAPGAPEAGAPSGPPEAERHVEADGRAGQGSRWVGGLAGLSTNRHLLALESSVASGLMLDVRWTPKTNDYTSYSAGPR
jgi:hypothetical protein